MLEARRDERADLADDWQSARHLEDVIGDGQYSAKDVEKARALLGRREGPI